jgi:galactofuranose transport system permease protein
VTARRTLGRVLSPRYLPLVATVSLFLLLVLAGAVLYSDFLSIQVFLNLLIDNAFLLVVALGMTFVVQSGGIDLSVGSIVALSTLVLAALVEHWGWSPWPAIGVVLVMGLGFGASLGWLIDRFRLQPFLVTLAGMFLARGLCSLISVDSISIDSEAYSELASLRLDLAEGASLSIGAIISLTCLALAVFTAHATPFGRTVLAIGGNQQSAVLMGLPVRRSVIAVYALSGFCAALGGVVFTFYMLSGYALHATGLELDAIAAVVLGGTVLAGGVGYVIGTLFGVLTLGLIQTLIIFDGTLSSWWARIVVGVLLFLFCLLQRLVTRRSGTANNCQ